MALLALLGLGASVSFLIQTTRSAPPQEAPLLRRVGEVQWVAKSPRRRPAQTLVWDGLHATDPIFEGDSIFVPPHGSARLRLSNGAELHIDANSLVVLEPAQGSARDRLKMLSGSLMGTADRHGLEIESSQGIIALQGNAQAHIITDEERAHVQALAGKLALGGTDQSREITAGQASSLRAGGQLEAVVELSVTLVTPDRHQTIYAAQPRQRIRLAWNQQKADKKRLQVSRDAHFAAGVDTKLLDPQSHDTWFVAHQFGSYWWRLVDMQGRPISETRKLMLLEDKPPELLMPQDGELVFAPNGRGFALAWTALEGCQNYALQVASASNFQAPIVSKTVRETQIWLRDELPEATYYWRVRAADAQHPDAPFAQGQFRLITKPIPETPETIDADIQPVHRETP